MSLVHDDIHIFEQESNIFTYGGHLEERVTRREFLVEYGVCKKPRFGWVESRAG